MLNQIGALDLKYGRGLNFHKSSLVCLIACQLNRYNARNNISLQKSKNDPLVKQVSSSIALKQLCYLFFLNDYCTNTITNIL